jgi:opine dehydrogenase
MDDSLSVAVLGGGNSAQTMAADLALGGFEVNLCDLPRFRSNIEHVMRSRQIEKICSVDTVGRSGTATLKKVTTDLEEAVGGVDVVLIAVPAYGHKAFHKALAGCLEDGQTVVNVPGNWGALKLFNLLRKEDVGRRVRIAETDVCMHICRAAESWLGPGKVRVILERTNIQVAAMPASYTEEVCETLRILYPQVTPASNVVETSLNNSNIIAHGPLVIMNAGWIEHTDGNFMIYRDGATPSVGRCVDAIRDERDAVLKTLGIDSPPKVPFYERINGARWVQDPCEVGPPSLLHRYITEDVPHGLVPMSELGDLLGVPTPVSDAIVELASASNQTNYRSEGTTLEKLGLNGLQPDEILKLVDEGKE